MSVDIVVRKMLAEDDSVLIYKPVGENLDDYPKIQGDEFLFGFANKAQIQLLELCGKKCIIIDFTHGMNQYGFQLTTVMINDENPEGMPVATLALDDEGILFFFQKGFLTCFDRIRCRFMNRVLFRREFK